MVTIIADCITQVVFKFVIIEWQYFTYIPGVLQKKLKLINKN